MTATARRLVFFAGPVRNPRLPDDPQAALVQGAVAVRFDPYLVASESGNVTPNADFWDCIVAPAFDKSPYVILYEAEMQDDGSIVVKRDLFGPGDFVHNWAGWLIPGESVPLPPDAPVPTTPLLTKGEREALQVVYANRRKT